MTITAQVSEGVLLAEIDNPPVNALGHSVREGLGRIIDAAMANPDIIAIVIACRGRTFCAGADITEFGKPAIEPLLPDLCNSIEALDKPVVAAIHGTALGGGLEVAMACHYRIAAESARLGMPEVKLGLLPGAGGTQRLPRLVGADAALEMIVFGNPVSAVRAFELGLVDRLSSGGELVEDAVALARKMASVRPLPRASERSVAADPGVFGRFALEHERKLRHLAAPISCIATIKAAAECPLAEGLMLERQLFEALVDGEQSAALRHAFFAERKASRIEGLDPAVEPGSIASVGIVGAGTMGSGIAMNFLKAGIPVTLLETGHEALQRGVAAIERTFEGNANKGRMTAEEAAAAVVRLTPSLDYADLAGCDLVIEAVFELMEVKHEVFAKLDAIVRPDAILATNTSYLDVDAIAAAISRPDRVIGLHFFSPANIMKLLEVVRGAQTSPEVLATAVALARKIGKVAVVSGVCRGFIGNRMLATRQAQALELLLDGATPQQIDEAHVEFGMPMGPFQMSDLAGIDIGWHRDPTRISCLQDALCAAGRLGQKAGRGYYDYDSQRRATPSPDAEEIIASFARASGRLPRKIGAGEILERTLYPMISEAWRILEEGIAQRASDVDVVWINGYGWPAWRGGPMFWADGVGLSKIAASLAAHRLPISPLLANMAVAGKRLAS